MFKWIFAVLGFAFAGIRGAFLGYLLGLLIDRFFPMQVRGGSNYRQGRPRRVSVGDFELNLLSLSAIVIKADGGISQRELDYVRAFFVQQFGKQRANRAFRTFND
ncbi:MAG TPA: TerB family tellurite resistance protein, partial [Flavobacteriaceae bacterium]|nr:TerB family tellurite resistance protein [Flavobacteriaceae bacterium]